jgi:MFS family permease
MRAVLRRPDFRLLFLGVVASMIGDSALLLALAIWVKQLTDSNALAGISILAVIAPAVVSPLLGWVVDRFRRRPFLVVIHLATAAVLMPLLAVRDAADVWIIFVVGVLYGAATLMTGGALAGLIKELLPEDLLAEANGALQTVRQGLRLVGPIGGAGLLTLWGGSALTAVVVGCLVLAAVFVAALKLQEEAPATPEHHWRAEMIAGVRYLVGQPALRRVTVGMALTLLVVGLVETLIFAYVDQGLHRGPAFVSVLICVQGVSGLAGGLTAPRFVRAIGEVAVAATGVAAFALGFACLTYPILVLGFVASLLVGVGIPLIIVGFATLLQRVTPPALIGRVSGASDALISTPQAISIAMGAALVTLVDFRLLFGVMAVLLAGAAWYLWAGRSLSAPVTPTGRAAP